MLKFKRPQRLRNLSGFGLLLPFGLVVLLIVLIRLPFFSVQSFIVRINDQRYLDPAQVVSLLTVFKNQSIFLISGETINTLLIARILPIESVTVEKSLPNKITLILQERKPIANLRWGEKLYKVDARGLVYALDESNNLGNSIILSLKPGRFLEGDLLGQEITHDVLPTFREIVTYDWGRLGIALRRVVDEGEYVALQAEAEDKADLMININWKDDFSKNLAIINVLIDDARTSGKKYNSIDLRFNRPVVKYQ